MNIYQDVDLYGNEDNSGKVLEYFESNAVKRSLLNWLTSKKGEYLYNPPEGGIFDAITFKLLNESTFEPIRFKIKNGINTYFSNLITLKKVEITPYYSERYTEINITYVDNLMNILDNLQLFVDSPDKTNRWSYEEIVFTGESLRNFVLLKKSDMTGKKLTFDAQEECWLWGNFKFTNFGTTSANFDDILTLCNLT